MGKKLGKDGKVALGSDKVVGIGKWNMDGVTVEEFDVSEFGDEWKSYLLGMKDGGNIGFDGHYDPADETGQEALAAAAQLNTEVTNLRLYIDNTSYFEPCQTTGYFSPYNTTGMDTKLSHVLIKPPNIALDKSGDATVSFNARINGCMVLV